VGVTKCGSLNKTISRTGIWERADKTTDTRNRCHKNLFSCRIRTCGPSSYKMRISYYAYQR